jgi:hypothetical protein
MDGIFFNSNLRHIIRQGDTSKAYRNLIKKIVRIHREYFTEENIPTANCYLQELLDDAFRDEYINDCGLPLETLNRFTALKLTENSNNSWDEISELSEKNARLILSTLQEYTPDHISINSDGAFVIRFNRNMHIVECIVGGRTVHSSWVEVSIERADHRITYRKSTSAIDSIEFIRMNTRST